MSDWETGHRPKAPTPEQRAQLITRAQIVVAEGVRWASNIVVEITSNYGKYLTADQRTALKDASAALARFQHAALPPEYTP